MRTEVVPWKSFFDGNYKKPSTLKIIVDHVGRHKVIYSIAGTTLIILLSADISSAIASTGIDERANDIYRNKLLKFGKWAIIIRGGWSTIQKTMQEDFDGAKKQFFGYLLVYVFLLAFPWAISEVDKAFA